MKPLLSMLALTLLSQTAEARPLIDSHFKSGGCFTHNYTAAYLADHPQHQIYSITLDPTPSNVPKDHGVLKIYVALRHTDQVFGAVAKCTPRDEELECLLAEGAGSFSLKGDKDDALRLNIGPDGMRFRFKTKLAITVDDNGDDQFILLSKADHWLCN